MQPNDAALPRTLEAILDDQPLNALQWRVLLLGALIMFMDGFDMQTMALTTPSIAADWGIPLANLGIAMASTMAGVGAGGLFIAPLSDRYGRRPFVIGALLAVGLGSLASAAAPGLTWLVIARFCTGIGLGVSIPVAYALVADFMPPGRRSFLLTCAYANVAIGSMVAGMTGASLIARWEWYSLFVVGGVVPLLGAGIVALMMPESVKYLMRKQPNGQRLQRLLLRLAPSEPVAIAVQDTTAPERQGSVRGLLAPEFRTRTLLVWGTFTAMTVGQHFAMNWLPSVLQLAGWAPAASMWAIAFYSIGGLVGGLAMAAAIDRLSPTAVLTGVFASCALVVMLFPILPSTPVFWYPLIFYIGAGLGGTTFALVAMLAMVYPSTLLATGIGWTGSVGRLGSISGPLIGSAAIAAGLGGASILTMLVVPAGLSAALMYTLHRYGLSRSGEK
ncbi:MAG: MFS transporter [Spongiibacteraceae bacterium]|nr:MFS transporter [Spongiibacteraceae bacterium]